MGIEHRHRKHFYFEAPDAKDTKHLFVVSEAAPTGRTTFGASKTVTIRGTAYQVAEWGENNNTPFLRQELICANHIVPQTMVTGRNAIMGNGIEAYTVDTDGTETVISELSAEIEDFHDRNDTYFQALLAAGDLGGNAQFVVQYTRDAQGKIYGLKTHRCLYIRSGKVVGGEEAPYWLLNGGWGTTGFKADDTVVIPYYILSEMQDTFCIRKGDPLFVDNAYFRPSWEGSRKWIEVSNMIPAYHIANFTNSLNPKWHIEYPHNFFHDARKYPDMNVVYADPALLKEYDEYILEQQTAFQNYVVSTLQGIQNVSGMLFSDYEYDLHTKLPMGIKITYLKSETNHEAYVKLSNASDIAVVSAQGVSPEIAGLKMSNAMSGANYKEALGIYQALQLPLLQKFILDAFYRFPTRINGWQIESKDKDGNKTMRRIHWRIKNVFLVSSDVKKTGQLVQ
jgi:hypothetical protein